MKSWYLIQSKPRQEKLAQENLERQNFQTYLPITTLRRRKRGKSYSEPGPMFPRYLFIYLSDESDDWRPIRSTVGVANLVKFGQSAARVPEKLIKELKGREDKEGVLILEEHHYSQGNRVLIAEGPFEGYEAIFQTKLANERVSLLLRVIEKNIKIEIDQRLIEPSS